jgi:hypothetical protein
MKDQYGFKSCKAFLGWKENHRLRKKYGAIWFIGPVSINVTMVKLKHNRNEE